MARVAALVTVAALSCLAVSPARAQSAGKMRRIGYLTTGLPDNRLHEALVQGLRELGWIEGQNIVIDFRFAEGRFEQLPGLAAELVRLEPDLIIAAPTPAALAASKATGTIPIVFSNVGDPVRLGLVATLARPGGNVTGVSFSVGLESTVKALELLTEAVPRLRRVAVLANAANPAQAIAVEDLKAAAQKLDVRIVVLQVRGRDELDAAFGQLVRERVQAVLVSPDSLFILHRARLAELALQHRLPSMHGVRENIDAGGLMSYGPSLRENSRRAAAYVDKILKGARPADLPVEQPTRFELVINMKTAKALGLAIPSSLRLRADEVIE